jgi:hypothetical protein
MGRDLKFTPEFTIICSNISVPSPGKFITGNGLTEYFFYIRMAQTETA